MGVLTDICIATEAELAATHFEGSAIPSAFFPTVQGKSLDPVMLAILEAVVTEQTPDMDTLAVRMDDEPLRGDASSEEWIYVLSERLVTRLAALTPAEMALYGPQWAAVVCQEWLAPKGKLPDSSTDAAALQYLQELCQLALQAWEQGKRIYMWMSL